MFYKYRDLSNLQFALDIFVNGRMFAAPFETLNDPMEGSYLYEEGLLAPYQAEAIYGEKNRWHLLSLSKSKNNMLMWSHYAAGHSGMVVGVEVVDREAEVKEVEYVKDLSIHDHTADIAQKILRRKFDLWAYEEEYRAFKRNEKGKKAKTFIAVEVRELVFGMKTDPVIKTMMSTIAKKFCPGISIHTIKRHELRTGRGEVDA